MKNLACKLADFSLTESLAGSFFYIKENSPEIPIIKTLKYAFVKPDDKELKKLTTGIVRPDVS